MFFFLSIGIQRSAGSILHGEGGIKAFPTEHGNNSFSTENKKYNFSLEKFLFDSNVIL